MSRLLSLFLIFALVLTQGATMAAAMCRHQNSQEHVLARESRDRHVASVSLNEEAAAAATAKKASQAPDRDLGHWPAEMLPPELSAPLLRTAERRTLKPARQAPLSSASIAPLLEPPSA